MTEVKVTAVHLYPIVIRQDGRLGRCDSDHLDIGCQPNGDHVLFHALGDTDAGIEMAGHDVAEAVVDDNVERSRPEFRRG